MTVTVVNDFTHNGNYHVLGTNLLIIVTDHADRVVTQSVQIRAKLTDDKGPTIAAASAQNADMTTEESDNVQIFSLLVTDSFGIDQNSLEFMRNVGKGTILASYLNNKINITITICQRITPQIMYMLLNHTELELPIQKETIQLGELLLFRLEQEMQHLQQ